MKTRGGLEIWLPTLLTLALDQRNFSSTLRSVCTLPTAGWAGPQHVWTW